MRIMTFNLRCDLIFDFSNRWGKRKDIVYKIMNDYNCDVIGTQEVTNDMFKDLSENFDQYNIIGKSRSKKLFEERTDILINKNHKIIEDKTFWLSGNPDKQGRSIWYSIFPRICTTALVELENKKKIRIYNTHLDCFFAKAREHELKKIGEFIKIQDEKENIPIIVMGDFNAEPNSKLIKDFSTNKINNKKFIPVQDFNKKLYSKSTMSNFKGNKNGAHIDYIFVSEDIEIENVEIVNYNIDGRYPSDHYPLVADVKIK